MASTYDVKETTTQQNMKTVLESDGRIAHTLQRTFTIALDDGTTDDVVSVRNATQNAGDLPRVSQAHPSYPAFFVKDITFKRKAVIYYEATVNYKTYPRQGDDDEDGPLSLPAEVSFSTVHSQRTLEVDADGLVIATPAGETIPLTVNQADLACTIQKNFSSFNPYSVFVYNNKVNADFFLGFPPGTALISDISATLALENETAFWKVTVQVLFREPHDDGDASEAWYQRVVREGFYEAFDAGSGNIYPRRCVDYIQKEGGPTRTSTPTTTRQWLDVDGAQVTDPAALPVYDLWKVYQSINFAALGLF